MRLSSATKKLAKTPLQGYDPTKAKWVTLNFGCQLTPSGRWIGRTEDFYNRRVVLTPEPIPEIYEVIRIGGSVAEYLLFANRPFGQPNYRNGEFYLFEYNALNAEVNHASLIELVSTPVASGISGKKVEHVIGTFPVAVDRYAGKTNTTAKDLVQSKCNVYIPTYAGATSAHTLRLDGDSYDIQESYLELSLTHLNCVKR